MSNLSRFLKQNKIIKKNEKYAPTASLLGEDGKPLEWEFKPITSKQNEELRENCTIDVQVTGKPNMFRQKLKTSQYLAEMIVASTVVPNLYNKELQESYEVKTPVELLYAMVDNPGEFTELEAWVQKFNGFDQTMEDKVEEAKN